jgi:hypothetical protein
MAKAPKAAPKTNRGKKTARNAQPAVRNGTGQVRFKSIKASGPAGANKGAKKGKRK